MPQLHWLTREADLAAHARVPLRTLREEPALSHGAPAPDSAPDAGLLVQGDNLQALRALLPFHAGRVRCIYIDPPYNTGSAFAHYDDGLEHATWLALMAPRLRLLREFLTEDGSIWVSIDDREGHYLKVLMDEIFGRRNFIANLTWQKRYSRENNAAIGDVHEHILVYSPDPELFKKSRNRIQADAKISRAYQNPNDDPRGPWQSISFTGAGLRANMEYPIEGPDGTIHRPPSGRHWAMLEPEYHRLRANGRIWFGRNGSGVPRVIRYLSEVEGLVPWSWWPHEEVGHTGEAKQEVNTLFGADSFDTPKPERLLQRILHIATNPGDLVLDSFLGSGTTAAVAHKMGRRWIGIEMGDHARTHCALRLRRVIDGEGGGISPAVGWQGGGAFRFCTLGPAVYDADGRIDPAVRYADLAAHVWLAETRTPLPSSDAPPGPVLGHHGGRAIALLYNGILKDRSPQGGNVLTHDVLKLLREAAPSGPLTVYGAACRLSAPALKARDVTFRQTPFDLPGRP
ncbi:site-specific DNA-methyltransferase [Rubellimicrobium aerolatum]|uniref:site-specific DNA-methyltransferase (adenine-specific) n=1 Tax=Rubellimicrobium aerolatum TaxID=490979 RepID=A0ABW0SGG4_9RHOB|nr:site-specific DNA-methyltransferase [Rubellimicrobium aerolatum]MBP1807439.1 adenine-specific DNA-methyltransferase [Rubellimicrobium aerolatum]